MITKDTAFAGSIPEIYDSCLGPLLFEPYALDIISRIPSKKINTVLEIACGTGRVTRHLRSHFPARVEIVATDLNQGMISVAKKRIPKGVTWKVADAQELPFADGSFDLVICQFGLMFVPDKSRAFLEAYRVLKPGGCFLFNTWDKIENNASPYAVQRILNSFFDNDPPTFYDTPYGMHDMQVLGLMLEKARFRNAEIILVSKEGSIDSAEDAARGFIEGNPILLAIKEKNPNLIPAIINRLSEELELTLGNHPMKSPMKAWVAKAWKIIPD